jgi:creatinine amidohydrolase/Fe(II)-dependent formamide hydrolase-like protein/ribosomal protein S18 acetylase RimI-like enzyme
MLDGHNTTHDWQVHTGETCVLPIGSFEQHAHHLPLDTDNIQAEFFARMVAEALDAALLPALCFGTCLEHSGFRGSMSLRPETLMQVIRDLAGEIERQGFQTMVLVNGHGGNHCLVPVVRDLNRADRPLKILLVDPWAYGDPEIASEHGERGLDIHAGEWETSVMLALRPDLVRAERGGLSAAAPGAYPLRQADLTTFGAGHFDPSGAIGYPSLACAEKGHAIIASIRKHLLPHVRDRIRRLHEERHYAGRGGIAIRAMQAGDIAYGMRLKTIAGWNQTAADWQCFLALNPAGCFVAVHNGRVVGTVTTLNYQGLVSWIGMLLVDPAYRRRGIGTRLMRRAIDSLSACETIKLDATPLGQPLYQQLGFRAEYGLVRMTNGAASPVRETTAGVPLADRSFGPILALDRKAFGADRSPLLRALWQRTPEMAWQWVKDRRVRGFCLGRRGATYAQIGPLIAERTEDAVTLCSAAMQNLAGQALVLDVPASQEAFLAWLREAGFGEERRLTRMVLGTNGAPGIPGQQFAIAGPELG